MRAYFPQKQTKSVPASSMGPSCLSGLLVILVQERVLLHHPYLHMAFDERLAASRLWVRNGLLSR